MRYPMAHHMQLSQCGGQSRLALSNGSQPDGFTMLSMEYTDRGPCARITILLKSRVEDASIFHAKCVTLLASLVVSLVWLGLVTEAWLTSCRYWITASGTR